MAWMLDQLTEEGNNEKVAHQEATTPPPQNPIAENKSCIQIVYFAIMGFFYSVNGEHSNPSPSGFLLKEQQNAF
jgi:hypothetical protein